MGSGEADLVTAVMGLTAEIQDMRNDVNRLSGSVQALTLRQDELFGLILSNAQVLNRHVEASASRGNGHKVA